jgi:hypothetical protein
MGRNNFIGPNGAIPVFNGGYDFANLTTSENAQIKTGYGVFAGIGVNTVGTTSTLAAYDGQSAPVTITIAAPGVITWPNHGLVAGDAIKLTTTGALPTGLTSNTTVYVAADANLTANTFDVSDTQAHAIAGSNQITTSGSQSGVQTAWNVSNPIGTYTTVAQGPISLPGAALALGLIVITAGGSPANLTIFYV